MKLWIDDERPAPEGWRRVDNFETGMLAVVSAILFRELEAVSFDHDLGGLHTGYDIAKVLEHAAHIGQMDWFRGELRCHSANPVGRAKIIAALRSAKSFIGPACQVV